MAAFTSMFEKPCISTNDCTGTYDVQQLVDIDGKKEIVVVCSKCKKSISKFQPA